MKLQVRLWRGAVIGSLVAFTIAKLIWPDTSPVYLLFLLLLGYIVNFVISLKIKNEVKQ